LTTGSLVVVLAQLFDLIPGFRRPFDLTDPSISYPYNAHETVSDTTLYLATLMAPAVIVAFVCLVFVPFAPRTTNAISRWRLKFWELNIAWSGLVLACATAMLLTNGMKICFGKPRPDLISRCQPDIANVQRYIVSPLGRSFPDGALLVDWHICQQPDEDVLADGFVSFPSGHSSQSFAGLTYLSLFLCAKFAVRIPYLLPGVYGTRAYGGRADAGVSSPSASALLALATAKPLRSVAAAPPAYLLVPPAIPFCAAIYIAATRYEDFRHHGFDILFGSLMGIVLAWASFQWYHAPIGRGAGWAWAPRGAHRAWWLGVGGQGWGQEDVSLSHQWERDDEEHSIGDGRGEEVEREVV
jgi:membrane-associated phospholipid phosphatase